MDPDKERFYRARILQRRKLTDDLWSIRVERDSDFRFVAGEYATLRVLAPHKHIERPYSIVSSPHESDLEFFLELVPRGELTPALHALEVGDEITIRKAAKGRFTLAPDAATHQNHLLLGTVTGVAPFVSYIRTLAAEGRQGKSPDGRRLFLLERRQPLLGVWIFRRTQTHRFRSSLAEVRSYGQPSLGRCGLGRGSGPR